MRWLIVPALTATLSVGAPCVDDFKMVVQDVFTVSGHTDDGGRGARGVVVTGVVEGGPVSVEDVVCLRPAEGEPRELTVFSIERVRELVESAAPGAIVGILFDGVGSDEISAGDTLTATCP